MTPTEEPILIRGGMGVDDRGEVSFVNDFDLSGVRRFYSVRNFSRGFVRAWHGHRREGKYVTAVTGAALVCAVRIDRWENPSQDLPLMRFTLTAKQPTVLFIPSGFANGFMSLEEDTRVMFFSTCSVEESHGDDVRFPARYWDPWRVEER